MKTLNTICMSALLMGAAAIAAPALAAENLNQAGAQDTAQATDTVQATPSANPQAAADRAAIAAAPATDAQMAQNDSAKMPADGNKMSGKTRMSSKASASDTMAHDNMANGQSAMSSGNDIGARSAANAHVDAVGDTSTKYMRKNRTADYAKEQEVTKQLNQQAATAAAPGRM